MFFSTSKVGNKLQIQITKNDLVRAVFCAGVRQAQILFLIKELEIKFEGVIQILKNDGSMTGIILGASTSYY